MSNTPPPYPVDLNDIAAPPYQVNPHEASSSAPSISSRSERSSRSGTNVRAWVRVLTFNSWSPNTSAFFSSPNLHVQPAVESAVTRLLVSIKALLESLTKWSEGKMSDTDVSDMYVQLGNDFNAAVAAFAAFGVEMKLVPLFPISSLLQLILRRHRNPFTI